MTSAECSTGEWPCTLLITADQHEHHRHGEPCLQVSLGLNQHLEQRTA